MRETSGREDVRSALLRLMELTPFSKISVAALCREAGVHRSTFYYHYGSMMDVAEELVELVYGDMVEASRRMQSLSAEGMRVGYEAVLLSLEAHRDALRVILDSEVAYLFDDRYQDYFLEVSSNNRERSFVYGTYGSYLIDWLSAGNHAIVRRWLFEGCVVPREQVVDICTDMAEMVMARFGAKVEG